MIAFETVVDVAKYYSLRFRLLQVGKSGLVETVLTWAKFKAQTQLQKASGKKSSKLKGNTSSQYVGVDDLWANLTWRLPVCFQVSRN